MTQKLCSGYNHKDLENCLKTVGHLELKYQCAAKYVSCYYIADCYHTGSNPNDFSKFTCVKISHTTVVMDLCCTVSC